MLNTKQAQNILSMLVALDVSQWVKSSLKVCLLTKKWFRSVALLVIQHFISPCFSSVTSLFLAPSFAVVFNEPCVNSSPTGLVGLLVGAGVGAYWAWLKHLLLVWDTLLFSSLCFRFDWISAEGLESDALLLFDH